jgi:hypothetical protein
MRAARPLALVLAAACGGGDGTSGGGSDPVPAITSISPDVVMRGAAGATVVVTGTGFVRQSVVRFNGSDWPTQFVSGTELRANLAASDLLAAGIALVTVSTPGAGQSGAAVFVVANPVPEFTALSVDTVQAGAAPVTVTITGAKFFPETTVWSARGTLQSVYVSPTQIRATLTAADVEQTGVILLYVSNPEPGGGTTSTRLIEVVNPAAHITAVNPTALATRTPGTVTITGNGFARSAVVYVGNEPRISFHPASATQMQVDLTATDVGGSGTLSFRVRNPDPGGNFSNAVTLEVRAPAPVITSLLDTSMSAGQSGVLAVNGSGFVDNSVILLDGVPRQTFRNDGGTQVNTTLTQEELSTPHAYTVTVSTPAPGGGVSNGVTFTVLGPSPQRASPTLPAVPAPPGR